MKVFLFHCLILYILNDDDNNKAEESSLWKVFQDLPAFFMPDHQTTFRIIMCHFLYI